MIRELAKKIFHRIARRESLIYVIIGLMVAFLALAGFQGWKNREQSLAAPASPAAAKSGPDKVIQFQVPILMYHYIRVAPEGDTLGQNLSVTPSSFDAQLEGLSKNDYVSIKVSDIADPDRKVISQIYAENKKPIALTFDDGYADAYTNALPILKKYQMIGTFYIIRNFVGRSNYMNQSQIDKLAADGMEIGSHSLTHPDLSTLDAAKQRTQIFDSKGEAVSFCYPSGKYDDTTVNLVKEAGYTTAVTTNEGIANQNSNLFKLPRVRVKNITVEDLLDIING